MENPAEDQPEAQAESQPQSQSPLLTLEAVPTGSPLDWPIADSDGTLLFAAGTILATTDERKFLFDNFHPHRGDLLDTATQPEPPTDHPANTADNLTLKDMHLTIGALIGVRSQLGSGAPMHPCRIIGFAPNHALFVTPPLQDGRILPLRLGENIEIVAIASHAVFSFCLHGRVSLPCPIRLRGAIETRRDPPPARTQIDPRPCASRGALRHRRNGRFI
nr:flagellar brake protein [Paraburkholderia agricolaris]